MAKQLMIMMNLKLLHRCVGLPLALSLLGVWLMMAIPWPVRRNSNLGSAADAGRSQGSQGDVGARSSSTRRKRLGGCRSTLRDHRRAAVQPASFQRACMPCPCRSRLRRSGIRVLSASSHLAAWHTCFFPSLLSFLSFFLFCFSTTRSTGTDCPWRATISLLISG